MDASGDIRHLCEFIPFEEREFLLPELTLLSSGEAMSLKVTSAPNLSRGRDSDRGIK